MLQHAPNATKQVTIIFLEAHAWFVMSALESIFRLAEMLASAAPKLGVSYAPVQRLAQNVTNPMVTI